MTFTPEGRGYDLWAPTPFDKRLRGKRRCRRRVEKGDVRWTEHIGPEHAMDANYRRQLDAARATG